MNNSNVICRDSTSSSKVSRMVLSSQTNDLERNTGYLMMEFPTSSPKKTLKSFLIPRKEL
jgi:hypothetical protein